MKLILTHEHADFDAVASMLGASKLYPDAIPLLPYTVSRAVEEFLLLYKNALPFINQKDWKFDKSNPVEEIILTDTQTYQSLKNVSREIPTRIIDHHPLERELKPYETWDGDTIGSASTITVEHIQQQQIPISSLEATLLALGIYADTGMLTFGGTTPRDVQAVVWLLEQGAVLNTIRRFLTLPLTDEQQILFDYLLKNAEHRTIQGHSITITTTSHDEYVEGIASITHQLIDIWDSSAIFTFVAMPSKTQLVCRSRTDDIDVSLVAEALGGGGHPKASAASIKEMALENITQQIWTLLSDNIQPAIKISDLMSYGVQYLQADDLLVDKLSFIRQIGHEGYPVVEKNSVVGLLTRRDADRATEHQLKSVKIRDVMMEGKNSLTPHDSVSTLEQLMVESGWGQIPIVDENNYPIGIVTRTDLIKHWATVHPDTRQSDTPKISSGKVEDILGNSVATLITHISDYAQQQDLAMYMVGGVVRDILLNRTNLDIDFVIEGDAIQFAETLVKQFGGTVHSHQPFGTAKWIFDDSVADSLNLSLNDLPYHIDFATARFEYYEQPTALPTVYNSGIKLDLQRRDFTINTLAIQLSPKLQMWRILDFYNGMKDLDAKRIRVLHSLSFVDDPTRILRAVRFSERLGFTIEARTADLIQSALPMLKRITGERIQHEIELILQEDKPENSLIRLQELGILEAMHSEFQINTNLRQYFEQCRTQSVPWESKPNNIVYQYWHLLMVGIPIKDIKAICYQLGIGRTLSDSIIATATLIRDESSIFDPAQKPSQITQSLERFPEIALRTLWIVADTEIQETVKKFMTVWRHQKATVNGNDLKQLGLRPGPQYKRILEQLRGAWIDNDITNEIQEQYYLQDLIEQEYPNHDQS